MSGECLADIGAGCLLFADGAVLLASSHSTTTVCAEAAQCETFRMKSFSPSLKTLFSLKAGGFFN